MCPRSLPDISQWKNPMKKKEGKKKNPLAVEAERALQIAVAEVIEDHKRTGDPLVIWRNGKVAKIPAEELEVREPSAEYISSKKKD
jgi:hypothetical protein